MDLPINGTCCSCEYSGEEETVCLVQKDGVHCNHWWEGSDEVPDTEEEN